MTPSLQGRRIALVGGAGFIGHHLALELHRLGAQVEIIDGLHVNNLISFMTDEDEVPNRDLYLRLINERIGLLRAADIPLHIQDARDYHTLSRTLDLIQPDAIVQLAAVAHAGRANKNPYNTFDHSMRTLENALDYAKGRVEHFVFFSSSMVYGNFQGRSVKEDDVCEPLGIYGALKYGGEKLVIAYNQVFGLDYTIVRPSALYGERCVSRRVGQVFIENALRGQPLRVAGDGSEQLDFTYIADLVDGLVRVLSTPQARNQIFNLTNGGARAISDLIDMIREEFPDVEVNFEGSDRLMPERGTLSIAKAHELLGYQPAHPVDIGFRRYIAWYRDLAAAHPELFTDG
jgi:nucleoside-diphosphate-sugar epimerase